ncbi:hypothetical protein DESUT3_09160 [Desulfuromonas versatilis]|uniref:HPt domain-containing protein n=1 Tax=Desulfuromonas versatilis TaxID=2802975 RepID=A0ABM8HTP8_9BACT|nr:Hpt domain-containing protein [Desulfuromonas versatilis]BCR03847.1 hypothetical protein DESUT3_09160 [Desulfuromonas versatilis]
MNTEIPERPEKIIVHVHPDLEDLVPGFLAHRREDLGTLRAALERGDYAAIRRLAHTMKGVGGGYGFAPFSSIGLQLQQAAEKRDAAGIERGLAALADYLERVEVVFDPAPQD